MMLTLLLLRHAKAEPAQAHLADKDRALAPRGCADAARIGAFIAAECVTPDLVLCSTARRTRETWELARSAFAVSIETHYEPGIYEATTARLLAIIRRAPSRTKCLMLVGHNPGLEELTSDLIRDGEAEALERVSRKYPTSGLAVLTLQQAQWAQVTPRSAHLRRFTAPAYLA